MRVREFCLIILLTGLTAAVGCTSPKVNSAEPVVPEVPTELAAILAVVERTYEVSSFQDATNANPDEFREPFTPTATLSFVRDGQLVERTVSEYVDLRRELLTEGQLHSLEEWELHGETVLFGNLAHHFSTYAVRVNGEEQLAERGIMSFQLLKTGDEWKVHSLAWQAESTDMPLPMRYSP